MLVTKAEYPAVHASIVALQGRDTDFEVPEEFSNLVDFLEEPNKVIDENHRLADEINTFMKRAVMEDWRVKA